jgi:uncharacterized oxidoreductase
MGRLQSHTLLITGGGTGIGLALAKAFTSRGDRVAICGRREQPLRDAAKALPNLWYRACDVTDEAELARLVADLDADGVRVSMLVNNAALLHDYRLDNPALDLASFKHDIATNLFGPVQLTHLMLPRLLAAKHPLIVNVNSPAGAVPLARVPAYSASKAGLHSYTQSLRRHLRGRVRVVEVFPPSVATPMYTGTRKAISSEACAARIVEGLERGREEIWIGDAKILRLLKTLRPFSVFDIVNDYQGFRSD